MESSDFTIECSCHTYITLKWNGKFIFCLDWVKIFQWWLEKEHLA